jgi:hypothetical protein
VLICYWRVHSVPAFLPQFLELSDQALPLGFPLRIPIISASESNPKRPPGGKTMLDTLS